MGTIMDPKTRMQAALKAAKAIADTAAKAGRDMNQDEVTEAAAHLKTFNEAKAEHESAAPFGAKAAEIGQALADIGIGGMGFDASPSLGFGGKSGSRSQAAKAAASWGARVKSVIEGRTGAQGAKALIGGTVNIPSVLREEPTLIDGRPTTLLDLIPRRPRTNNADPFLSQSSGNTFEWVAQTGRNLAASSVPDNAQKPVSGVTFAGREDRFRVYATITDPIEKRLLDDHAQLIEILQAQLGEGLLEALEADILNGTGVKIAEIMTGGVVTTAGKDPVKGILQTSGILAQAYTGSLLQTLSNARYTLEDTRVSPNAWVMNSRDLQGLELMREDGGTGPLMFGSGRSDIERILGDYPIVTSSLITQGSALLGDFSKTELIIREDDHLDVDGSGELFKRNQVIFREEGRYGFAVNKPSAFISVDLTA